MTLSFRDIESVAAELALVLQDAICLRAAQVEQDQVVVTFKTAGGDRHLLLCARPGASRLHLTAASPPVHAGLEPAEILVQVNRDLKGGRVASVRVLFRDRVVGLGIHCGRVTRSLVFECSAHHPNLFLVDERQVILAMLRPSTSRKRSLGVGKPYVRPIPIPSDGVEAVHFLGERGSVSEAVEAHYKALDAQGRGATDAAGVRARLCAEIRRLEDATAARGDTTAGDRLDAMRGALRSIIEGVPGSVEEARRRLEAEAASGTRPRRGEFRRRSPGACRGSG